MANEKIIIGQFILFRDAKPDTPDDPYDPARESLLEDPRLLPNPGLVFTGPASLPRPPVVDLSPPAQLPRPPAVDLSSPAALPDPPPVDLSSPHALPPPPAVTQTLPSALPPPPAFAQTLPTDLPLPPAVNLSSPDQLPDPPAVPLVGPAILPPPPDVNLSSPAPEQRQKEVKNKPSPDPKPPVPVDVTPSKPPPDHLSMPVTDISSGYLKVPFESEKYSPLGGGMGAGSLAGDPILYERQLERTAREGAGKNIVHAAVQATLFSQNNNGKLWNPALAAPPPLTQNILRPALDTVDTTEAIVAQDKVGVEKHKLFIGQLLKINYNNPVVFDSESTSKERITQREMVDDALGAGLILTTDSNGLSRFPSLSNGADKYQKLMSPSQVSQNPSSRDVLAKTAFIDGIIPMRVTKENQLGFTKVSTENDLPDDDAVYVPVSFTDLRPIGNSFRTIYFRPIITGLAENISPEWNKKQYYGRVDPVATYQSTTRTISLGFQLMAFAPEDVETIYKKLHWLSSMVYPEYDNDFAYKSGPVVRMRIGDVVSAVGTNGIRGLPGIIESLEYDYSDALWELKKNMKLPRAINVGLSFTVLHDTPVGRGSEGKFGGLGEIDQSTGRLSLTQTDATKTSADKSPTVSYDKFRKFGNSGVMDYVSFADLKNEE